MNGSKSTFKRKGYWLTAFAAIVLLAASPGTASAQVTVTGPDEVAEGGTVTYAVAVKGYTQRDSPGGTLTVTLLATVDDDAATGGEAMDLSTNRLRFLTVRVPAGPTGTDAAAVSFSSTGVIRLQTLHDLDAEDEKFTLQFNVADVPGNFTEDEEGIEAVAAAIGDDAAPNALTIEDDETQSYDLTLDDDAEPKEGGGMITATITANPAHVDGSADLTLQLDAPRTVASIPSPTTAALSVDPGFFAIVITLGVNDKNRVEDTITLSAYSGTAGNSVLVDSLSIDVEDNNALPAVTMIVVDKDDDALDPQPTSVAEGESVRVAVMVLDEDGKAGGEAAEDLTVALMPTGTADSADYTLAGSFEIGMGDEMSNALEIEVRSDEDVGMESLMFDAVVSGDSGIGPGTLTSTGVLSLYIEDETAKKITPKASEADYVALMAAIAAGGGDDGVNPGDTVTIMTGDLFDVIDGYTASYGVSVEGDSASASASGESVTINALMAGEAKITVTGTARMASSSLIPTQTVSNVAELTFPVMVVDTTLVVTLSAEPMEIEAGGTTMITATANRAVTAGDGAVEIALAVVGDGMLDADSITIAMGDMSGSATLTANESVTVVATGSGVSGLMQVAVTATGTPPEPVPALPLIAQWLLGLGLMGGGARQLYRWRRQG